MDSKAEAIKKPIWIKTRQNKDKEKSRLTEALELLAKTQTMVPNIAAVETREIAEFATIFWPLHHLLQLTRLFRPLFPEIELDNRPRQNEIGKDWDDNAQNNYPDNYLRVEFSY